MRINNIFSALVRERTSSVIQEFVFWILTCVVIVMSIVAAIVGGGNIAWVFLMLFSIGLALLLVFRLKAIAMIYSACSFYFIMSLICFFEFLIPSYSKYLYGVSNSILNIILFVFIMLLSIGLVTCQFIQAFSKIDMGSLLTIMTIVDSSMIVLLQFLTFLLPSLTNADSFGSAWHAHLNAKGYWIGVICYWTILVVMTLIYVFSFWGKMDSKRGKVLSSASRSAKILCIAGAYAGRTFTFTNGLFVIGSGNGVSLRIPDTRVSYKHCSIRYNPSTGFYEVLDESSNGTFLTNGSYLPRGTYNSIQRGTIICIGTTAQQFQLL